MIIFLSTETLIYFIKTNLWVFFQIQIIYSFKGILTQLNIIIFLCLYILKNDKCILEECFSLKPVGVNQSIGSTLPQYHPMRSIQHCIWAPHNLTSSCQMLPGTPNITEAVLSQGVELFIVDDMALHRIPGVCIDFLPKGTGNRSTLPLLPTTGAPVPQECALFLISF